MRGIAAGWRARPALLTTGDGVRRAVAKWREISRAATPHLQQGLALELEKKIAQNCIVTVCTFMSDLVNLLRVKDIRLCD